MPDSDTPVEVNRARPNHAIWKAPAMARCVVHAQTLKNGMGTPEIDGSAHAIWCVRDGRTGAHLKVWSEGEAGDNGPWLVAWMDGPRYPGSGKRLADVMCGEAVGGELELF